MKICCHCETEYNVELACCPKCSSRQYFYSPVLEQEEKDVLKKEIRSMKKVIKSTVWILILIGVIALLFHNRAWIQHKVHQGITFSRMSEEEYREACLPYEYKAVLRNQKEYEGELIRLTVQLNEVIAVDEDFQETYYVCSSMSGDIYYIRDVRKKPDMKLLEDDYFTVYGEIHKPSKQEKEALGSDDLFMIEMKYVDLISD